MNNEPRYDEIKWSCNFDNSRINVTAYDLENGANVAKTLSFAEVLGMISDDGSQSRIEITQRIEKFDKEEGSYYYDEDTQRMGAYAFFAELTGRDDTPNLTLETRIEYTQKVTEAILDILEGKKKLLILK